MWRRLRPLYAATPAPSPVIEHVVPAPAVPHAAPAPVIEYTSSAPVIDYMEAAPAVTLYAPSHQLPPAYNMTTDTTDDNFDITSLVNPQFSITAVEAFCATGRWFTSSFRRVCCARVQPNPSGTDRCRKDDPAQELKIQLCKSRWLFRKFLKLHKLSIHLLL